MASVTVQTQAGKSAGNAELSAAVFGIEPNMAVMHQVVTAQLAAKRAGTHSTRTRREVSGGGAKPWRQKGTGRARAGTTRAPQWRGGGVAHGPKPRDYSQRTPKKMIKLALASAPSDRAADGKVIVVLGTGDENAWKSFRNLPQVHCLMAGELNTYDVLNSDVVVFTEETLPTGEGIPAAVDAVQEEEE